MHDTGSFSASVSGERTDDGSGDPLPSNASEASLAAGNHPSDGTIRVYGNVIFQIDSIDINGWKWMGTIPEIHDNPYSDVLFFGLDATIGENVFIILHKHRPIAPGIEEHIDIYPGQYSVFTYLATHYLEREWETDLKQLV